MLGRVSLRFDGTAVHCDEAARLGARRPKNHRPTLLAPDRTVNATHLAVLRSDQHTPNAASQRMPINAVRRGWRLRPTAPSSAQLHPGHTPTLFAHPFEWACAVLEIGRLPVMPSPAQPNAILVALRAVRVDDGGAFGSAKADASRQPSRSHRCRPMSGSQRAGRCAHARPRTWRARRKRCPTSTLGEDPTTSQARLRAFCVAVGPSCPVDRDGAG